MDVTEGARHQEEIIQSKAVEAERAQSVRQGFIFSSKLSLSLCVCVCVGVGVGMHMHVLFHLYYMTGPLIITFFKCNS